MERSTAAERLTWADTTLRTGDRVIVKATGQHGRIVHLYDTGTADPMAYVRVDVATGNGRSFAYRLASLEREQ